VRFTRPGARRIRLRIGRRGRTELRRAGRRRIVVTGRLGRLVRRATRRV
jgi:hypothetical protein